MPINVAEQLHDLVFVGWLACTAMAWPPAWVISLTSDSAAACCRYSSGTAHSLKRRPAWR